MEHFGQVAVVGAGWAGLACAVELAAAGLSVTVFEAGRTPGGRARSVDLDGHRLDNGQHLLVGAYGETLRLMRTVGADPDTLLDRQPLRLDYPGAFRLALPPWPAPWHLAAGLLAARGATLREKLSAATFMSRLKARRYRLTEDLAVADWLDREGQHGTLRRYLWEPLCLAALNTAPAIASAQIFANVLRDSLGGARDATDLLLQRSDLGRLFPEPAVDYLARNGSEVRYATRVRGIVREGNGWRIESGDSGDSGRTGHHESGSGAATSEGHFEHLVLAVAPQHLAPLLVSRPAHAALLGQLADYAYEPIGTLYAAYPENVRLPFPMLGLRGPLGQWVFDRGRQGGPAGMMAFVLSADGDWEHLDDDALGERLHAELTTAVGPLPPPRWRRSIRERRATFSCRPNLSRPGPRTAERGLWLAGDHVCADYPATLEGAVRSGVAAARAVLADR